MLRETTEEEKAKFLAMRREAYAAILATGREEAIAYFREVFCEDGEVVAPHCVNDWQTGCEQTVLVFKDCTFTVRRESYGANVNYFTVREIEKEAFGHGWMNVERVLASPKISDDFKQALLEAVTKMK